MANVANRRQVLAAAGVLTGAMLAGAPQEVFAGVAAPRVRRNFGRLDRSRAEDRRIIEQLTEGVRLLRERSRQNNNDPRGWSVQAGLHTRRCQHGNWWFLPWHRAYLHYFERLIQDAVSDQNFALPYWDWTDPSQLALPAEFREQGSPLFDPLRRSIVNSGQARLNWSGYPGGVLDWILRIASYVPGLSSPAAASFPQLVRQHGPDLGHGSLEGSPHDQVHVWVAGNGARNMGNPVYAALDPIFWLHHCNLDRLWTRWMLADARRRHPASAVWRNQEFEFLDTRGRPTLIAVSELLNARAEPLSYAYEDEPTDAPERLAELAIRPADGDHAQSRPHQAAPRLHHAGGLPHQQIVQNDQPAVLAVAQLRYRLGADPLTVKLALDRGARNLMNRLLQDRTGNQARSSIQLVVEDVVIDSDADEVVAVYLDPAEGEPGDRREDRGQFLGTVAMFGAHEHLAPPADLPFPPPPEPTRPGADALPQQGVTRIFDVTDAVLRLHETALRKGVDDLKLSVRLVRRPLDAGSEIDPEKPVSLARVSLREER
jgi:hypothetical protein